MGDVNPDEPLEIAGGVLNSSVSVIAAALRSSPRYVSLPKDGSTGPGSTSNQLDPIRAS
jgi:hypothetical protein